MNKLFLLFMFLLPRTASAGDSWVIHGPGGAPVPPPTRGGGVSVGPSSPNSATPPDGEFYARCGGVGYGCNFLKGGADGKFRDEAQSKVNEQVRSFEKQLQAETSKLDADLAAIRNGSDLSNSPQGKKAEADRVKSQEFRESTSRTNGETMALVKSAEGKASTEIETRFGLAFGEAAKRDYVVEKERLDVLVGKSHLQRRIEIGLEYADEVEDIIEAEGGEYKLPRLTMAKMGRSSLLVAQDRLDRADSSGSQIAYKLGITLLDLGLGFVPGVSTGKDAYEAISGKSLLTGEKLTAFERTMAGVGVVTLGVGSIIGKSIKTVEKGAEIFVDVANTLDDAGDMSRVADDARRAVKAAENMGAKTADEMQDIFVDLSSPARRTHILNGDDFGGGHMFPGKPTKSVFPESWSADKIMHEVSDILTDPSVKWTQFNGVAGSNWTKAGKPARYDATAIRDGVEIKVSYRPGNGEVITAFPLSGPGVFVND